MAYKKNRDSKLVIPKGSDFSNEMSKLFKEKRTVPFEKLWKEASIKPISDADKSNYNIIQFSFVIINKKGHPLFIERKRHHNITKGDSILQSCSPYTYTCPRKMDDIRSCFEQEIKSPSNLEYDLDLLGIAKNVKNGINYYFYIFRVKFNIEKPNISIKTEKDHLKGFLDLNSSNLLKDNKVDLRVMEALFPEFRAPENKVEGCILHKDKNHYLRDILFLKKKSLLYYLTKHKIIAPLVIIIPLIIALCTLPYILLPEENSNKTNDHNEVKSNAPVEKSIIKQNIQKPLIDEKNAEYILYVDKSSNHFNDKLIVALQDVSFDADCMCKSALINLHINGEKNESFDEIYVGDVIPIIIEDSKYLLIISEISYTDIKYKLIKNN